MKITYNTYHAVGSWRWDLQPPAEGEGATKMEPEIDDEADSGSEEEEDEDEEEDEVCGICQLEFESSCPGCKVPGDDCPLMWGQCTHVFHMHCLLKWLNTESSKEQCPLDRRPWVTAERHTSSHGAPVPSTRSDTGSNRHSHYPGVVPGIGAPAGMDDRSMMTIGEESDDVELRLAIEASRAV